MVHNVQKLQYYLNDYFIEIILNQKILSRGYVIVEIYGLGFSRVHARIAQIKGRRFWLFSFSFL